MTDHPNTPALGSTQVFLAILAAAGLSLVGLLLLSRPEGDLASQTNQYLEEQKVAPLSGALEKILSEAEANHIPSQGHPLLGKSFLDLELPDHLDKPWRLSTELSKGPVVLVFYYGYVCTHCVGQLFALNKDLDKFRELGAQIVAVGPDRTELTRARFAQYGPFNFPVLSDSADRISASYGAFESGSEGKSDTRRHGTFLINRKGVVTWCNLGDQPFTDNRTLLYELAKVEERMPPRKP